MDFYTELPEWHAEGEAPPQHKRNEGWNPEERVPASWLNWFFHRTYESLREIAQAFIYHRDASAPHDGHETKEGANAKVKTHSDKKSGVHGVGPNEYLAKTSRSDQRVGWGDIVDKPSQFPMSPHDHDDRYYTKSQSDSRYAPIRHSHGAADLPKASTSQEGIVRLTNDRTSRSETLALTARAMDDHRLSADHDGRYCTKNQLDSIMQYVMLDHWTRTNVTSNHLFRVAYANGLWVAVGSHGRILTSTNGTSWTSRSSGTTEWLNGVAYGNGLWVAVGDQGTVLTSTNGTSWTGRSVVSTHLLSVAYGNGLWVAVGTHGRILTSTNGTSWTGRDSGVTNNLYGVAYGNGLWVAVGASGRILTSTNGTSWSRRVSGTSTLYNVVYANGLWVILGEEGILWTSTNGDSWASRYSGGTSASLQGAAYGNGLRVVVGGDGTILSSTNEASWTPRASCTSNTLYDVAYANGLWVAVGLYGTILTTRVTIS